MTSLTDVYEGRVGRVAGRHQQLLGTGLFLAGAAAIVGAIALVTTTVGVEALGKYPARELGGVLAGLGLPAVLVGVFVVLPAALRVRAAAIVGASVAVLGVAMFTHGYPYDWVSDSPLYALATTTVYLFGVLTTFWCLFIALATFKTRRDPGGLARMEITKAGTIELVQAARRRSGFGGVGLFGTHPDGEVETQTNRDATTTGDDGAAVLSDGASGNANGTTANGGYAGDRGGGTTATTNGGTVTANGGTVTANGGAETDDRTGLDRVSSAGERSAGGSVGTSSGTAGNRGGDGIDRVETADGPDTATFGAWAARSTGRANATSRGSGAASGSGPGPAGAPGGDGGAAASAGGTTAGGAGADGSVLDAVTDRTATDEYCGDCAFFEYVKADGEPAPYCNYFQEVMDDMQGCEKFTEERF